MQVRRTARTLGEARLQEQELRKMGTGPVLFRAQGLWRTREGKSALLNGQQAILRPAADWARVDGMDARPTAAGHVTLEGDLPDVSN
jgi:hypothetical protein